MIRMGRCPPSCRVVSRGSAQSRTPINVKLGDLLHKPVRIRLYCKTVGWGIEVHLLSRRTVLPPTMMASLCARVAKTRCRDCLLDTHAECPVLAAIFPAQTHKVIISKGLFLSSALSCNCYCTWEIINDQIESTFPCLVCSSVHTSIPQHFSLRTTQCSQRHSWKPSSFGEGGFLRNLYLLFHLTSWLLTTFQVDI